MGVGAIWFPEPGVKDQRPRYLTDWQEVESLLSFCNSLALHYITLHSKHVYITHRKSMVLPDQFLSPYHIHVLFEHGQTAYKCSGNSGGTLFAPSVIKRKPYWT